MNRRVGLALLAAGAIATAAFFAIAGPGLVREAVELTAQGGETQLLDTLRPARGGTRVIVIALDGVGRNLLRDALTRGAMPRLAALMGEPGENGVHEHAYASPDAVSILPSTTIAAWSSVYTGEPPAETGVPGNEWFDRRSMRYFAPAPVSVSGHEHTLAMLSDGLVGNSIAVPTLLERAGVRSYVSLAPVFRGADIFTMPDPSIVADLFATVAGGVVDDSPIDRDAYAVVDTTAIDNVIDTIGRHGLADLQVLYFPGIDLYTHGARDPLQAQERYLADRSTCVEPGQRCDWHRAPRTEEDVLPVARAFDAANRTGEGVPALLGTLDMIMIRSGDDETGSWMSAA